MALLVLLTEVLRLALGGRAQPAAREGEARGEAHDDDSEDGRRGRHARRSHDGLGGRVCVRATATLCESGHLYRPDACDDTGLPTQEAS